MERKYIAFISYRHARLDTAVARQLHSLIEKYTVPRDLRRYSNGKKHLGTVFRDQDELAVASDLSAELRQALDNSEFLIVVCTRETLKSVWVREEIRYFLSNKTHNRRHVLAVLAEGEPAEAFPHILTWDEAQNRAVDPLAADVRAADSVTRTRLVRRESMRLFAAILGCNYDDLIQRERRRRIRLWASGAAAVLAVAVAFCSMLLVKNREIDAQKKQVQLRESELLTADAEEALKRGDIRTAIESAISALPKPGDENRPYYAPAESALLESMDLFGGTEAPILLSDTVLQQVTSIANFCLSQDGARAVTIDQYGGLRCFHTVSGEELWTAMAQGGDGFGTAHLLLRQDQSSLICCFENTLECRDMSTGAQIWSRPLSFASEGYFIYDSVHDRIACVDFNLDMETLDYRMTLVILSAGTGEVLQSVPLRTTRWTSSFCFSNRYSTQLPAGGTFSEDGAYFAGAFIEETENEGQALLNCFVADLTQGTVESCCSQELEGDYYGFVVVGMELREEELLTVLQVPDATVAALVLKLDWKQGMLLWQTATPAELDEQIGISGINTYPDFRDTVLYVGRSNGLYAIDIAAGQIMDSAVLPGILTSLQSVSESEFGFSLSDGTYAIGWYNSTGIVLTTEALLQVTASIGEHDLACIYKGGIVQFYTDGAYMEISVSNVKNEGYVAVVNSEQENRLVIKRPVEVEKPVRQTQIELPTEPDYCADMYPVFCSDDNLILGPFAKRDNGGYSYFYAVLDTTTHTVRKVIAAEEDYAYNGKSNYFLPDASGYVHVASYGYVAAALDGQQTILAEPAEGAEANLVCASSAYLADNTVLTARVDADQLTLWYNGGGETTAALPEAQVYTGNNAGTLYQRFLKAGANGYVLTGCFPDDGTTNLNNLAVYNTAGGEWSCLTENVAFSNTAALATAKNQPLLALMDDRDNIRIIDLEKGETVTAFPVPLPHKAILFLDFLLDDTHLMMKTRDALLLIYDLSTGELKYQEQLDSSYGGELTAYEDSQKQRLYIVDSRLNGDPNGICLDLPSWTKLGSGSGMVCFDEKTGELYHFEYSYNNTSPLSFIRMPDTDELVQMGQQLLEME